MLRASSSARSFPEGKWKCDDDKTEKLLHGEFSYNIFGSLLFCFCFLGIPLMSSRHKCWQLGKKYAVNMRWPSAAAELQTDLAYFPRVCNHALQELFSLFGKSTVPTCCFSPAGLLSLLAIAWVSNFLADTGVLSQPVGEACQSPGTHWKLPAAAVPWGISSLLIFPSLSVPFASLAPC